jgi:hypothetical protein
VHSGLGAEKWLWHRPPGGFADLNDNSHTSFVFPKTFLSYNMCDVVVNMFTYQLYDYRFPNSSPCYAQKRLDVLQWIC